MAKRVILSLVTVLIIVVIGLGSKGGPTDTITPACVGGGLVGLMASVYVGKTDYSFLFFAPCGLILGFVIGAGLNANSRNQFQSVLVMLFFWLGYAFSFVLVGRLAYIRRKSIEQDSDQV